jgi:hypothetical protein
MRRRRDALFSNKIDNRGATVSTVARCETVAQPATHLMLRFCDNKPRQHGKEDAWHPGHIWCAITGLSRAFDNSQPDRACSPVYPRPTMSVITVKRTVIRRTQYRPSLVLRSFRGLSRSYFASERSLEFVVEALLFAIMVAISAWPILAAIDALNELLQRTPS